MAERVERRVILRDWFVRRRTVWQLTWTARLLLLAVILGCGTVAWRGLGTFLAVDEPVDARYLVVEGWMPAFAYADAARRYREHAYERVIAVGALAEDSIPGGPIREFAAVGSLVAAGIPAEVIDQAVGATVNRDRTYHSALNVRAWLRGRHIASTSIDVMTLGPHARRSRLLFSKALGPQVRVGVVVVPDRRFDLAHWWRSSEGVRSVLGETLAYVYARCFFDPDDLGCVAGHC